MGVGLELHVTGPDGSRVIPIGDRVIHIGRSPDNDVALIEDNVLSRQHCTVELRDGEVWVRDLNSRHGTWTRGKRLELHRVQEGDAIFAGRTRLLFLPPGSRTPPLRPPKPRPAPGAAPPSRRRPPSERQPRAGSSSGSRVGPPPSSAGERPPAQVAPAPAPEAPPPPSEGPPRLPPEPTEAQLAPLTWEEPKIPRGWPGGIAPADRANIAQQILSQARAKGASDVHVTPHVPLTFRIGGEIQRLGQPLTLEEVEAYIDAILTEEQRAYFNAGGDYDFCYAFEGGGRFRTNCARQRSGNHVTMRIINEEVKSLEEIGIPSHADRLTKYAQGLVLVTGPMGAGKTTTMMSLVKLVNDTRPDHIITVEDPIEFLMPGTQCQVSQRQLGIHTESFGAALRAALREDPDIIVIGDMRDYDTTSLAISASETGHLVFASMHAMNCAKTLDKLIDMFPAGEQNVIRVMVSESLRGIICQRLVPGVNGDRVPVVELLFNSIAIGNIIRENKTASLINAMQLGRQQGMRTIDMSLQELVEAGKVDPVVAFGVCENKERFISQLPYDVQEALRSHG